MEDYVNLLRYKNDEHINTALQDDIRISTDPEPMLFFKGDYLKWYDDFPDVKAHHYIMEHAIELYGGEDVGWRFIRIGEESDDIEEESQELVISKPAEEIKALQESIIDQFIQNQPSLSKPKKNREDDDPIEDLAAVEFSLPVSETIAILLTKQGKYLQAIELYEKLSLIKPEKRVYFASRIEELQKILTE
ncbi:MAG: hypothetical protein RJA42_1822, partial [Bacteroidota bacterium]